MQLSDEHIGIIRNTINAVMQKVYNSDIDLIERGGMERSLAFRFGLYFADAISEIDFLNHLTIDLEYNKNGVQPKRTPRRPNGVVPDFLLHSRGNNDENCLVVEFKGWWNNEPRDNDIIKLEDFVSQEGEYSYSLGTLIEFLQEEYRIEEFKDY